jgi:hypothetical protein
MVASTANDIRIAITEIALPLGHCRACERQGLPILPLRQALVPATAYDTWARPEGPAALQPGLRTLRAGYLYVLLDRKYWQAYRVTPDGYLRQFDPGEPPLANDTLLTKHCTAADHDIPSSFLNIDVTRYKEAWVAFAHDPWPERVLENYKAGQASQRFQRLDLAALREAPDQGGLAMTPQAMGIDKNVYEYQEFGTGRFSSAHVFYSRAARMYPLRSYVRNAMQRHALDNGVPALVLADPVGLVQEYNHLRNGWVHARQQWMADPDRAYQHQTSQILLAIREVQRNWAQEQASFTEMRKWDGTSFHVDLAKDRQRFMEAKAKEADQRLEERYDEPQRARFQADYEHELKRYQRQIDESAEAYATVLGGVAFAVIEEHDYDGNDLDSAQAYVITLAQCLRGGISEAPVAEGREDAGPTARLWRQWLEDRRSPVYRALLSRDINQLSMLLPSFDAEGEAQWNDSLRIYDTVTRAIASAEGKILRESPLREAAADLLSAFNAASMRLRPVLEIAVEHVMMRINSVAQLLYNRMHLTELKVTMKLSEYYRLQSEHLRDVQRRAVETFEKGYWSSPRSFRRTGAPPLSHLRPIILGGLLNLAVLDPRIASLTVTVSVWVEGKASELREALLREAKAGIDAVGQGAYRALVDVTVGVGTLEPQARQLLDGIKVSSQQAASWVRTGLGGLRGVAGSGQVLMAVGSLYLLSDMARRNFEAAAVVIGDKSSEATVALYGSAMGVVGSGVEVLGLTMANGAKALEASNRLAARGMGDARAVAMVGTMLARLGALMGAAVGVYDAVQAGMAVARAERNGDESPRNVYLVSTFSFGVGATFGSYASVFSSTSLMGPLGIAVLFGLIGYALFKWAESNESSPLELWAKRSFFGFHSEDPPMHWSDPDDALAAIAQLNAITLGVDAGVSFRLRLATNVQSNPVAQMGTADAPLFERSLDYGLVLPHYDSAKSAYSWALVIHRHHDHWGEHYTGGETIAGASGSPPFSTPGIERQKIFATDKPSVRGDYRQLSPGFEDTSLVDRSDGGTLSVKEIKGTFVLPEIAADDRIEADTLFLTYWPDVSDAEAYAEIEVRRS